MVERNTIRLALAAATTLTFWALPGEAQKLLPWQQWVDKPIPAETKDMNSVFELPWANSGGKEGELSTSKDTGPWGGKYFNFHVKVDHHNAGSYPQGWPSFEVQPKPNLDFNGYGAIRYWIRCDTERTKVILIRFILWTSGQGRISEIIPGVKRGEWVQVTHAIAQVPDLNRVERLHFFICESDYDHNDELTFKIGGFQLLKTEKQISRLPANEGAMGLWVGERADTGDQVVLLELGAADLPGLMVLETGADVALEPADELRLRFHEVFTGKERLGTMKLGESAAAGTVTRLTRRLPVAGLGPGYYLVTADLLRKGHSVLGGRVGCDDFYIRKPKETMTYTVLSVRTGMALWIRDLLHGDLMGWAKIALPHVYDPLAKDTYAQFLRLFASCTWKCAEGNEAGDTGLALAAEAFRKSSDMVRCKFAEWLLEDSLKHMVARMQSPTGGCLTLCNELEESGIGFGGGIQGWGSYDSNQIGEWMRPFAYAILYYRNIPEKRGYVKWLNTVCRKSADYLAAHAVKESDGLPKVMRHLTLIEKPDGTVQQVTYHQEGRQCDVYLGRALSGFAYYAYAMQLLGQKVPDSWWQIMDNTVKWTERKMKPNGWFDWQCEDVVEGGCHTFLGNIYIGEGLFGVYLADRQAGRQEAAQAAAEATKKAYRYVTDDCYIKGQKYEYPLEFWVGPYVYWLFTEYLDTVGPEEKLQDWLKVLDAKWSVERGWHDFLDRAPTGGCGRTESNGMLAVAILGYLGIKQMAEIGKPLHWVLR